VDCSVHYTYPLCPTCNKHHKGCEEACIKNHNIDKELLEAKSTMQCLEHFKRIKDKAKDTQVVPRRSSST